MNDTTIIKSVNMRVVAAEDDEMQLVDMARNVKHRYEV